MSDTTNSNYKLPEHVRHFTEVYKSLTYETLPTLHSIYHENITFIDPISHVKGIKRLQEYFRNMYKNLLSCQFDFERTIVNEFDLALAWVMSYSHPRINGGNINQVHGCSVVTFCPDTRKAIFHRDYFDMGEMLYEKVPLLGGVVRILKRKMESSNA